MDGQPETTPGCGDCRAKASVLGDLRQRRILSALSENSRPMALGDLSVHLAARENSTAPAVVSESARRSIRLDLQHRCLPNLEAAGWVKQRPDGIVADEPFAIEVGDLSQTEIHDPEDSLWEAVGPLLVEPRRQELVAVLVDHHSPLDVDDLTTELRNRGRGRRTAYPQDEQRLLTILHHVDLPTLTDIDLIEYDAGKKTVVPTPRLGAVTERIGLDAGYRDDDDVSC